MTTATHMINEYITASEVRLIGERQEQIGVISTRDALDKAQNQGLDLVVINESKPPVAKILNYSKFRYQQLKHEKELAKKARAAQAILKEIQLRPVTETRDIEIKAKKAQSFLTDGDRVKVIIKFKGRELSHAEMGRHILQKFLDVLTDHKIEKAITLSGKEMFVIVAPVKIGSNSQATVAP